jgi:uncharacterized protein
MAQPELDSIRESSREKLEALHGQLRTLGSALVAYSGGVDSTFLLKVAHQVLGARCVALLATGPSLAERERASALEIARAMGVQLIVRESRELEDPRYAANSAERCYFCKSSLFAQCARTQKELGLAAVLDGTNAEDGGDFRPGLRAAREAGVLSPLADVGLTKQEIRAWSKHLGLPTWNKPQMACLASRVPYGTEVTAQRLKRIGAAEQGLWDLGLRQFRVRYHGPVARIEVAAGDWERLADPALRERMVAAVKRCGFLFVSVDLEPFRSGRMNEAI